MYILIILDVVPEVENSESMFLTTVDEGDEEPLPSEVMVAPPTLSREEMYFVVRDLWKLRDELRSELGYLNLHFFILFMKNI